MKVGTQWRLYCLVHNIEKLAGYDLKKWRAQSEPLTVPE